jgi:uncharacterized protein (DUF433 family)
MSEHTMIASNSKVMLGNPAIRGSRITLEVILKSGKSARQLAVQVLANKPNPTGITVLEKSNTPA